MSSSVDLYNSAYRNYHEDVYREIRVETYGEDLGQTSWVTTEESREIPAALELSSSSHVLEIGCGSGRYALQVAATVGCRIVGLDINAPAIRTANELAAARNVAGQVSFEHCDASERLRFEDRTFDAVFSNDVLCHVPGRAAVLRELYRVLRPNRLMLFSDALVIGGMVSHQEIALRSSIGYYVFSPPGENERLIAQAGFQILRVSDTTANAAIISKRWHGARQGRRQSLIAAEGEANFEGLQRFLQVVHSLTSERRLLRFVYLARKPG